MSQATNSMLAVRRQFLKMWPENCCEKTTITQGTHTGEKETIPACANDCAWQELARLIAIAEVDVDLQTPAEKLAVVAKIHEEDCIVLSEAEANDLSVRIQGLMYFYSYNRQGSDQLCVFCQERGQGSDDQIKHRDCDGEKYLALLDTNRK